MKEFLNKHKVEIFAILFFVGIAAALGYQRSELLNRQSVFRETPNVDELDFHFMAVNFALKNQFPVVGFLTAPEVYNIHYQQPMASDVDSMYLSMFHIAGSVHSLARPPLSSFLAGLAYKIFGVRLCVLIWYNILLIAFCVSLFPYLGYKIYERAGLVCGLIAAFLFLKFEQFSYTTMDVEILSCTLFFLIFFTELLIQKADTFLKRFFLGVFVTLGFLCKPVIVFFLPLYLLFYFFRNRSFTIKEYLMKVSVIFIGLAITFLPWSVYINREKKLSENERRVWAEKIEASMTPPLMYDNKEELLQNEATVIHALTNFLKRMYIHHTESEVKKSTLLVSNQFHEGLGLMFLNNEYCVDNVAGMGSFGWMWESIRTSYYNTHHPESPGFMKMVYFYLENPSYIYLIPAERLKCVAEYPLIFWLAPALCAMLVICKRLLQIKAKVTKQALLLIVLAAALFLIKTAFIGKIENPLLRVGFFLAPSLIGLLFLRKKFDKEFSGVFYVSWLSIFFFILLAFGHQRFTKTCFAVNCFAIVFYFYSILKATFVRKEGDLE